MDKDSLITPDIKTVFLDFLRLKTYPHFLDSSYHNLLILEEDINTISGKNKEILAQYFEDYKKYKIVYEKFKSLTFEESLGILNDEQAKKDFVDANKIIRDDKYDVHLVTRSGQKILKEIIDSKSIYNVLSLLYPNLVSEIRSLFSFRKESFEEYIIDRRTNSQVPFHSLKEKEIEKLQIEFKELGGYEVNKLCSNSFKDFTENLPRYENYLSLVSSDFKRDSSFFKYKAELTWEYLNQEVNSEFFTEIFKEKENEFNLFISNHLNRIIYVFEFKKHIEYIKSYEESPFVLETTGYSMARRVLALKFLLKKAGVDFSSIDNTDEAQFMRFITNTGLTQKDIRKTTVYNTICKLNKNVNSKDSEFIRDQFLKLKINI